MAIGLVACTGLATACSSDKTLGVETFDDNLTFEYLTDAILPSATLDGQTAFNSAFNKIKYRITSPEYKVGSETKTDIYEMDFPAIYCDKVGDWKVEYIYGGQKIEKTFKVKDTIAPDLGDPLYPYDVYKSDTQKYSLPAFVAEDPSGIDYRTMVKKLTINGEEVNIDGMDRYIANTTGKAKLEFSVCDTQGNKAEKIVILILNKLEDINTFKKRTLP